MVALERDKAGAPSLSTSLKVTERLVQAPLVLPILLCQGLCKYHQDRDSVSTGEKCGIGADICKVLSSFDGLEFFFHLPTS